MTETQTVRSVLEDGFGRIHDGVAAVVDGLSVDDLLWRPDADANHIAWLIWHLSRQQDEQLAHLAGHASAWVEGGWAERFGLPYPPRTHGYGMSSAEVGAFTLSDPTLLTDYHQAVHALTVELLAALTTERLGEVIDARWDPPVTVAVRIVSVLEDAAKHLGQAEYVRGMVERRRAGRLDN
jgi:hypothetical protein